MVDVINSGSSRKRVIGYGRVSTEEQEANYSLDAQKSRFETLCEQNRWESLGFHSETASGTSIRERPVLCQVIQQIKGGGVDALWVKEIDRLTRPENLGDISDIAELLASTDTLLIVDTREANLQEDASVLMLDFEGVLAKYFRRQLLRNMDRGKRHKAQMGRKAGGADPFGYVTNESGEYRPHPEQSKVVKLIFNLAMNDFTVRQIALELDKRSIPTSRGGEKWGFGVVASILKKDIYIGIYRFQKTKHGKDVDGSRYRMSGADQIVVGTKETPNHPPIVEAWVFDVVQAKLNARKKETNRKLYMATGLLHCPSCGETMQVKYSSGPNSTKVAKYACKKKPNCDSPRLSVMKVDRELWNKFVSLFTKPDRVYSLLTFNEEDYRKGLEEQMEDLAEEQTSIQKKQGKLVDLYMEGDVKKTLYTSKNGKLESRLKAVHHKTEELQKRLEELNQKDLAADLVHTLRILARSHKRFTEEQRTKVFRSLVKEAHLKKDGVELELYVKPIQNLWWKFRQDKKSAAPPVVRDLLRMRSYARAEKPSF